MATGGTIEVERLSKNYGSTPAIADVSFSVEAGEIMGFLGPNGAGKTTTMRILTGYLPATSGKATVAGYEVHADSMAVRQRIGYLPETPPLYPDMTVEGYLDFVARLKLVSPGDRPRQIREAMERCHILDKSKVLIRKLSKGYRQRVGIAQAIVHNPSVIILDEPTSGLDPRQIIEVRNLIKSLAGERTIIISTHILPEVTMTCNKVAIIDRGKLVAADALGHLMSQSAEAGYELDIEAPENSDLPRITEIIRNIPGVSTVELVTPDGFGSINPLPHHHLFRVSCTPDTEPTSEIVAALASNGVHLSEMRRTRASLEDIFLNLTNHTETAPDVTDVAPAESAVALDPPVTTPSEAPDRTTTEADQSPDASAVEVSSQEPLPADPPVTTPSEAADRTTTEADSSPTPTRRRWWWFWPRRDGETARGGDEETGRRGDEETGRRGDEEMVPQSPNPPVPQSPSPPVPAEPGEGDK